MTSTEEQEPREPATPQEGPLPDQESPADSPFKPFETEWGEKDADRPGETRDE